MGWYPVTWEGWAVTAAFVLFITYRGINPSKMYVLEVLFSIVPLLIICCLKGEKPEWRWGIKSKNMNIKSILLYVKDVALSSVFYQKLGFKVDSQDDKSVIVSLVDFQIQLLDKEKVEFKQYSEVDPNTFSVFFYIEVDDVDEKHKELISKGLTPATTPKDWPWGNREFVIKDPDGYKLVIYKGISLNKKSVNQYR